MLRPYNALSQIDSPIRNWGRPPKEELHGQPLVCKKTDEHAARGSAGRRRAPPEAHARPVSSGWSNHFIELLNIFHIKMPLWLAYDHWTGLSTATKIVARQMAQASDTALHPGTQAFLDKVDAIVKAQSPELLQSSHALLNAPTIFGTEIGFNLPAFLIALIITAVLVLGIKESAHFNSTIVALKG